MLKLAEAHVLAVNPYIPSQALNNHQAIPWAYLGSNENCLGPSPAAIEAAHKSLAVAHLYPNNNRYEVVNKICASLSDFKIRPQQVALGNGTSEIIVNLVRGLLSSHESMMTGVPTFIMYSQAARAHGRHEILVPVKDDFSFDLSKMLSLVHQKSERPVKLIFLANPNNPTGNYISKTELDDFISQLPKHVVLVIDEAYCEYVVERDYPNALLYACSRPRTLVLRTFSKIYGLAGLRLGYAVGDPEVIDILCRMRDPFNVNSVVQYAAMAALDDSEHVIRSVEHNLAFKPQLLAGLKQCGFLVHDSVANFVIAKRSNDMPQVQQIAQYLLTKGVEIRAMDNFGLPEYVRIAVGTKNELTQLINGLSELT